MLDRPGSAVRPSLTLKRRLEAPPQKVYAAWTRPEQLTRWIGPGDTVHGSAEADLDVRVGGRFRIGFHTKDGERHEVAGVYREVTPGERLVFTWAWHSTPDRQSLVTLTFKADGDGTLLTLLHEKFFDEAARDGHRRGWTESLDRLERYFA